MNGVPHRCKSIVSILNEFPANNNLIHSIVLVSIGSYLVN